MKTAHVKYFPKSQILRIELRCAEGSDAAARAEIEITKLIQGVSIVCWPDGATCWRKNCTYVDRDAVRDMLRKSGCGWAVSDDTEELAPEVSKMPNKKRIIARFHPQAWVKDYAVDVDAEGPVDFDVTDHVLKLASYGIIVLRDNSDLSDTLRATASAPSWILNWRGPFYIEVEDSIREYYKDDSNYCPTCRVYEHDSCSLEMDGCPCCADTAGNI